MNKITCTSWYCAAVLLGAASHGLGASAPTSTPQAPYEQAIFRSPARIALDATGTLFVADSRAGQVVKLDSSGSVLSVKTNLSKPLGVAVGNQGLVYVGEEGSGRVLVFNSSLTNTPYALGTGTGGGTNEFLLPNHIAVNTNINNGWIYVADSLTNQIKCYTNSTLVKTIGTKGSGNGQFDFPAGVYVSPAQELFVVDQNNDRVQVFNSTGAFLRVFSLQTTADMMMTNIYGRSQGITGDNAGRVYIADAFQCEVKVFDTNGTYLSTIGSFGEWTGLLQSPVSVAMGTDQRLFVASLNNNRVEIYNIQSTGGGATTNVTLTVISAQGGVTPGTLTTNSNTLVNEWVTNSPVTSGTTQYVCTGAAVSGNSYSQVNATNVTLTLTNSATLTWQWQTNYQLSVSTSGSGTVNSATNWYVAGTNVTLTATPSANWNFSGWSGNTGGCVIVGNVLTAAMTQARSITATFTSSMVRFTVVVSGINGTASFTGAVQVASGASTTIVYTASDWYRIQMLTTNLSAVAAAANVKVYTQVLNNITAAISNNVSFYQPAATNINVTYTNVTTAWLAGWGKAETNALYNNSPLTLQNQYLLGIDPYKAETNDFRVTGIAVTNPTVTVYVKLNINSSAWSGINGALKLYGYTNLTTAGSVIGTTNLTSGAATFQFTDTSSNKFYKAAIE